ncbi:hypothetical protein HALLA_04240 (plasmid) [Halostagnicola larsenii XH-48]|uniref:Uncharacterized protein n=1 Tax=Halostagnicola larsenii XH-48 TaxID=797299 RepID=W0JWJ3_9EURY|nr:hypothetical protein [Halostagnicola larsenii]AHG01615.1 hypothetical protein HALLA_04240 [Halostagnicola larsenii XH-48]
MSSLIPILYYGGLLVLFFFWIYGIVSFARDVKRRVIPGIKQYRRGRRRLAETDERDREREENERQLY